MIEVDVICRRVKRAVSLVHVTWLTETDVGNTTLVTIRDEQSLTREYRWGQQNSYLLAGIQNRRRQWCTRYTCCSPCLTVQDDPYEGYDQHNTPSIVPSTIKSQSHKRCKSVALTARD